MKKTLVSLLAASLALVSISAQTEKEISSELKKVVVFPYEAQAYREAKVNLYADKLLLKFTGLSPNIRKESIRVDGDGSFTILNVNYELDYMNVGKVNQRTNKLNEKIKATKLEIEEAENKELLLKQKTEYFQSNQKLNDKTALTPESFKNISAYYLSSIEGIRTETLQNNRKLRSLRDSLTIYNKQLAEITSNAQQPTGIITVLVNSKVERMATVKLSYLVDNASWYPTYDIRFESIEKPLKLSYKATIQQNTGEDWRNVKLSLSTAQTQQSTLVPTLYPFYLNYYNPAPQPVYRKAKSAVNMEMDEMVVMGYGVAKSESFADDVSVPETQISQKQTSVSFEVEEPQSVKSEGKTNLIRFREAEIPCTYEYKSIPKLSDKVYLMGKITDWFSLGLQSGEVNLYFENAFVGTSSINTQQFNDTLDVSFGADQGLSIKRDKIKEFNSKSFFGNTKKEQSGWKITVKNNKDEKVSIRIFDQLPISKNEEIKVESLELSGGKWNKETGEIEWKVELAPKQNKEIILKYLVQYPKGKVVIMD
jgi:uncharacterized protein (TIGR02231 family)